ncbi:MAG: SAM-dependent methyltransferase [Chlorobi bacterium]|nr:SAM-dependent methyltransferase [Chlorobiota bacterium]
MAGDLYLLPSTLGATSPEIYLPAGVIKILHRLKLFFAEDIRTARRFIKSTGYPDNISIVTFYELSEHTTPVETERLLQVLQAAGEAGLISEAGLPAVADPGATLVHLCHRHGIRVHPLTGPSSIMLALMASGMNGQHFTFHGYLPRDPAQRRRKLRMLEQECNVSGNSQVFMETPYRNLALLKDILQTCHKDTWLCIAAGLTTDYEFIDTRQTGLWERKLPDIHKIPAIFIVGKPQ